MVGGTRVRGDGWVGRLIGGTRVGEGGMGRLVGW